MTDDLDAAAAVLEAIERDGGLCVASDVGGIPAIAVRGLPWQDVLDRCDDLAPLAFFAAVAAAQTIRRARG